jgi:adenylylsulfate kinase
LRQEESTNITWHAGHVERTDRERLLSQKGVTLWLTGLSGSGKSSIAVATEAALFARGRLTYRLDGDNIRHGLNRNLGFSPAGRTENIRRIGEVAKLFTDAGAIVFTSFISPYRADRDAVRAILGPGDFVEVHVSASLETCEKRDVKGLYEPPEVPDLLLDTDRRSIEECVERMIGLLEDRQVVVPRGASGV